MPGTMVKDWDTYHALRAQGKSKREAAIIANSRNRRKKRKRQRPSEYAAVSALYMSGHTSDLPPVIKHAQHRQKSHGNWARISIVRNRVTDRRALLNELDQQGVRDLAPIRGVVQNYRGTNNVVARDDNGNIVGAIDFSVDRGLRTLYLNDVRVTERRQGYGQQMLAAIAAHIQELPHGSKYVMKVQSPTSSAVPWYMKMGANFRPWTSVGTWEPEALEALRSGNPIQGHMIDVDGNIVKHGRHNQKSHGNWARGIRALDKLRRKYGRVDLDFWPSADREWGSHQLYIKVPDPNSPPPHPKFPNNQRRLDVSWMSWDAKTGQVYGIRTDKAFKRQGYATALFHAAEKLAEEQGLAKPVHSDTKTSEGRGFVSSLEGRRAKLNVYVPKSGKVPEGVRVRGEPIEWDDSRIPDTLYHATTNLNAVIDSGKLRASGAGGLGGDPKDKIVSLTANRKTALQIGKDLKLASTVSRMDPEDGVAVLIGRSQSEGWDFRQSHVVRAYMEGYKYPEGYGAGQSRPLSDRSMKDWLTDYFQARHSKTGRQNPLIFSSIEELQRIDPDDIGIVTVPKRSLRDNKSLITNFDLGEKVGLDEVRVYGDVSYRGNVVVKISDRRERIKKHGTQHREKSHGNWARGIGGTSILERLQFAVGAVGGGGGAGPVAPTGQASNWIKTAGGINNARAKKMKFLDAQGNPITLTEARALIKRPGKTVFAYSPESARRTPARRTPARRAPVRATSRNIFTNMHPATDEERKRLKIPPAWTDVHVHNDPDSPLQAKGRDAAGRVQSRYSDTHHANQAAKKFTRIREMASYLPKIDSRIEADIETSDEAAALMLIRRLGLRPGSTRDTRAQKKAYGATTLLSKHVSFNEKSVTLHFTGKKGVDIRVTTNDPDIMEMLQTRVSIDGNDPVFNTSEAKTRDYFYGIVGNVGLLLKDLRTVKANVIALDMIEKMAAPRNKTEFKKKRNEIGDKVSKALGNTRTVALQSYISPAVFDEWEANVG